MFLSPENLVHLGGQPAVDGVLLALALRLVVVVLDAGLARHQELAGGLRHGELAEGLGQNVHIVGQFWKRPRTEVDIHLRDFNSRTHF